MIFAASVVYFAPKDYAKTKNIIEETKHAEIHFEDEQNGKIVIITEGEDNNDLENIKMKLLENDFIENVDFHAFHFGEEVERVTSGNYVKDFDIENAFKKFRNKRAQ